MIWVEVLRKIKFKRQLEESIRENDQLGIWLDSWNSGRKNNFINNTVIRYGKPGRNPREPRKKVKKIQKKKTIRRCIAKRKIPKYYF